MGKNKYYQWLGIIGLMSLIFLFGIGSCSLEEDIQSTMRADVITLDTLMVFGALERPPVNFKHELHTEALQK
ncbi:hypothetical protein ACFL27_28140, partial [candidate division CSSED10-310 bacterium]